MPQQTKKKITLKDFMKTYLILTVSSMLYAVAVSLFLDPNSLAPGGVTGISIIMNRLTGLETGTWIMIINVPILLVGTWKFGFRFIVSTLYCTALSSITTNILALFSPITTDPFLASIIGGVLMALGLGWIFKAGATTGGTDIIVKLLRLRFPHLKTGALFLLLDAVIVTCSAIIFKDVDKALYAGLTVIVTSMVLDLVLYGRDGAKLIYIISDTSESITQRLLEELDLGVTYMSGIGAYSGKEKKVIFCAVKKQRAHKVETIVKEEDAMAFMIVTSASEIYGEGYKSYFSEKL
ncbi:YitT family protein [Lachnospiraceae bacterium OttesenSCG-928-D06]|nr:YitT family protein [Lachnospiraceae bacterium OttesenSCG-928-D06]